jgi:hypothetical protein
MTSIAPAIEELCDDVCHRLDRGFPRWLARASALGLALALGGCPGETGTVTVSLTTAPGSTLLDGVQTLRLVLTNPRQETTAQRTATGFDLSLELPATDMTGALLVDGLDVSGILIANGASPPFPLGGINGRVVIYMAAPNTIGASPRLLDPARSELAIGVVQYGAILAGGKLGTGEPSDALAIYNAFDHTLLAGMAMPAARAAAAIAVGDRNITSIFGGRDSAGVPTGTLWRFDPSVAPSGAYLELGDKASFARADQLAVPIGGERFLVTGAPVAELFTLDGSVIAREEIATLPATGAAVVGNDGIPTAIFAGPDGVVRVRNNTFSSLSIPEAARAGASAVAVPGGKVLVACGGPAAIRIDAASGTGEVIPALPVTDKTACALAATGRHVLVAGGLVAGAVDGTAEIYDASTLALVASLPLVVPRANAIAVALPNDQILIAGGVDATGAPIATLELFTPAN